MAVSCCATEGTTHSCGISAPQASPIFLRSSFRALSVLPFPLSVDNSRNCDRLSSIAAPSCLSSRCCSSWSSFSLCSNLAAAPSPTWHSGWHESGMATVNAARTTKVCPAGPPNLCRLTAAAGRSVGSEICGGTRSTFAKQKSCNNHQ